MTGVVSHGDVNIELMPHQLELVETFFSTKSRRVVVLRGDVGLGKSTALVAVTSRLLRTRSSPKVLFLVPSLGRAQFAEKFQDAAISATVVDRYKYREMVDSAVSEEFWPSGAVTILGQEFAVQDDIVEALTKTRWDMLVIDEAHSVRASRAAAVQKILKFSERALLATTTLADIQFLSGVPTGTLTVVEWQRDSVVGYDGKSLEGVPRPTLHEFVFTFTPAEERLRHSVRELARAIVQERPAKDLTARSLISILESSPAALERALLELIEGNDLSNETFASFLATTDEEEFEVAESNSVKSSNQVFELTKFALMEIDALGFDLN